MKALPVALLLAWSGCAADAQPAAKESNGVTFAGSMRVRVESADADLLGPSGPPSQTVALSRMLASADWRFGDGWRAFAQLGWHQQTGRKFGPAATDVNDPDLQQVYLIAPLAASATMTLGRQEIALGSSRLVSVRDGPNIRRAFDGARFDVREYAWRVQAFAFEPVLLRPDSFDDRPDATQHFYGLYATRDGGGHAPSLDLYVLELERRGVAFGGVRGREARASLGARVFGKSRAFDYNIEPILQIGTFRSQDIRAWTIASDMGWTGRSWRWTPRFGVKADVTSGDSGAGDDTLETFNPLYPNFSYFSEAATISPQNHIDVQPEMTLTISPKLSLRGGVDVFWRTRTEDAIYRSPGIAIPRTAGRPGRFTAVQPKIELTWKPTPKLDVRASLVGWSPGDALKAAGGEDGLFAMASVARTF